MQFDHKNHVLSRGFWDPSIMALMQKFGAQWIGAVPPKGTKGFSAVDFAFRVGGWAVDEYGAPFSEFGVVGSGLYSWDHQELPWVEYMRKNPVAVDNPANMSRVVKRAALLFGADLVGITRIDPRWLYSHWFHRETKEHRPNPLNVPEVYKYAIVMAVEMDYDLFSYSPDFRMSGAVGMGYSRMASISAQVAAFIKSLGYCAVAAGNDTAISIPLAIDAGLGEQSRLGLLVTKQFGPRVRLCKVFTDLPLEPDKPIKFGVEKFCTICDRCAKQCPSQSIPYGDQTKNGPTISNYNGLKRWYINPETCFEYFARIGTDCGKCIRVCPWNKPNTLFHAFVRKFIADSSFRRFAMWADEVIGYGKKRKDSLFEI